MGSLMDLLLTSLTYPPKISRVNKFNTALFISLMTVISSIAGLATEAHIAEHHHQKNHDHHHDIDDSLLGHLIFHSDDHRDRNHTHEAQNEGLASKVNEESPYLCGPLLLVIPSKSNVRLLRNIPFIQLANLKHGLELAYSPPPDHYRNLPLLN